MTIVIPVAKKMDLDIGGVVYSVSEPTLDMLEQIEDAEKNEASIKAMRKMYVELGLPDEILGQLGVAGIKAISEAIMGEVKGKK